ncbi:hypothetical protein B0H10DRAFT_1730015, partial [Mycena sp. CBHHK59/15]
SVPMVTGSQSAPSPDNSSHTSEPADVQLYLEIHNVECSEHGALALVWNDTLADVAQTWGTKCTNNHSGGTLGPFGGINKLLHIILNLAVGTGQFNISDALGLW